MTHKDYIAFAAMLDKQRLSTRDQELDRVRKITIECARIFYRDNPCFKASLFFAAAGFPELFNTAQGS